MNKKPTSTSVTENTDLTGRTALVTGATSGLGRECARVLALRGARVLMVCRNQSKAAFVIREFSKSLGTDAGSRCCVCECDLSSMQSVRTLTNGIAKDGTKIDLIFLNAGVFNLPFQITTEGFEYTYAANYVGHFLMVHNLLSSRSLSPVCRIMATLSESVSMNPFAKADFEMLFAPQQGAGISKRLSRYGASPNSKIFLLYMMREFCRRVDQTAWGPMTFNGGDPGGTKTGNINQMGFFSGVLAKMVGPVLLKDVEQGAAVLLWMATSKELEGRTGKVFKHGLKEVSIPDRFKDETLWKKTWDLTEERLGLSPFRPERKK